jgi:CubicO group peptidase (beta-lactamase class C family)
MLAGPVLRARLLFKFRRTHDPARVRPPGEYSSYSNYGATLAGYIVERVSGLPYDDYVEQNILTPLNMAHSTSRQPVPAAFAADLSEGYEFIDGQYQVQPFETVNVVPAGGLSSTASEMAYFMIAHLQDGTYKEMEILQAETARQMHTQHFAHDPRLPALFFSSRAHVDSPALAHCQCRV